MILHTIIYEILRLSRYTIYTGVSQQGVDKEDEDGMRWTGTRRIETMLRDENEMRVIAMVMLYSP